MPKPIRLVLAFHNHQPIGNFDDTIEQAYQDSYLPFLDVFSRFESLKIALHTSGSLIEWLDAHHPEYLDRVAELVAADRIEILGGAFYEPILAMIPSRDRVGQVQSYSQWLENRLGGRVRGMWIPERVWEQSMTRDLVAAGIEYTILDDCHFKNAGLLDSELHGHYLTEDEGRVMSIFPGSEPMRYMIPFGQPHDVISHLAHISETHDNPVVVFGDDGEKFGTWPDTHRHVYQDRWLERFFESLVANQEWLQVTTLSETVDHVDPIGKVYLPDSSYREMTEWALPADRQVEYDRISHDMKEDERWPVVKQFVRGGFWRNFKIRYPESDEMYSRMMSVSRRLDEAMSEGYDQQLLDQARTELYRGQCNCSYWHGAFGGIYLPHLRNAVYERLIAADNLLDRATGRPEHWVEAVAEDFNFDAKQEIRLENDRLVALLAPSAGGQLYELDLRSICHNLLATLTRSPEAYHRKVLAGPNQGDAECASIHDRVVFKQEGLDQRVQYDDHSRNSLIDFFYDCDVSIEAIASGQATQHGDFVDAAYETKLRRNPDRVQVHMSREGRVHDLPIRLSKAVTLSEGSPTLEISYVLENLPQDRPLHFGVELNFAGMPSGIDDRYFHDLEGNRLGQLGSQLDLTDVTGLGLVDEWLGLDVGLKASRPTHIWTFPIETVSQSEGGFELVHQSVMVQPHWIVTPDADGRWSVTMHMAMDTSMAESRNHEEATCSAT